MTPEEYLGDWAKVIDFKELNIVLSKLNSLNPNTICPPPNKVFKAFKLCKYSDLKAVFIGQDPYPQQGVATGILFGNKEDTIELSPSLEVIKECCINYEIPHNTIDFDITLESWAKQGILMLNSALTCEVNNISSHALLWEKFMANLIYNLSHRETGILYVLFGKQAQSFEPYIDANFNYIIKVSHPSYYDRVNQKMPYKVFKDIGNLLYKQHNTPIKWYNEY